jgi:integrase
MQFRDIFTKDIIREPSAATVVMYCLNQVADVPMDITIGDHTLALLSHEVAVDFQETEYELRQTKDNVITSLERLEKIRKIEILQREETFYKIKFRGLDFPIVPTIEKVDKDTKIIPLEFDEWKRRDLKYLEHAHSKKYHDCCKISFNYFSKVAGGKMVHEITRSDHEAFWALIKKRNVCNTTLNNYTKDLKASLSRAVEKGHVLINPLAKIRDEKVGPKEKPITLSRNELEFLLQHIKNPILKYAIYTAGLTGLRRGEIAFLKWSDIDYEKEIIHIQSSEEYRVKFNKPRSIPLTAHQEKLFTALKEYCKKNNIESEFVFPNKKGNHFHPNYLLNLMKRTAAKAGMDTNMNFHTLRRTFASMLKADGTDITVIKDLLGHTSERTTRKYIFAHQDDMEAAMIKHQLTDINFQSI